MAAEIEDKTRISGRATQRSSHFGTGICPIISYHIDTTAAYTHRSGKPSGAAYPWEVYMS